MNRLQGSLLRLTLCLVLVASAPAYAATPTRINPLMDVEAWICFPAQETNVKSVSGAQGFWAQRNYRLPGGALVRAIWMSGKGFGAPLPQKMDIATDDGPLGSGNRYKTFARDGISFIFEDHPTLGKSLIASATEGTLTLESTMATEQELVEAAEKLLR